MQGIGIHDLAPWAGGDMALTLSQLVWEDKLMNDRISFRDFIYYYRCTQAQSLNLNLALRLLGINFLLQFPTCHGMYYLYSGYFVRLREFAILHNCLNSRSISSALQHLSNWLPCAPHDRLYSNTGRRTLPLTSLLIGCRSYHLIECIYVRCCTSLLILILSICVFILAWRSLI